MTAKTTRSNATKTTTTTAKRVVKKVQPSLAQQRGKRHGEAIARVAGKAANVTGKAATATGGYLSGMFGAWFD